MPRLVTFLIFLFAGMAAVCQAGEERGQCHEDVRVTGACYKVHARLRIYTNMRPYLWPVGSRNLLGIAFKTNTPDGDYFWPADLAEKVSLGIDTFGDFYVCPFTPAKTGKLQIVCVDAASNLVTKPRSR